MAVLFTQHWDVIPGKYDDYSRFVSLEHIPAMQSLGLNMVGGYYVVVGEGPRIVAVATAERPENLQKALGSREYRLITSKLLHIVCKYSSKVYAPTGKIQEGPYRIQTGVWKFNQYYNVLRGMEDEHYRFVKEEAIPGMKELGLPITGGWRLVIGTGPLTMAEASAKNFVEIAKAVDTPEFRRLIRPLKTKYSEDYSSRILAPTGRIDVPYLMDEMMKSF